MEITTKLKAQSRAEWRSWLLANSETEPEVWLVSDKRSPSVAYLDSIEEAICFGWIDSIAKRVSEFESAQRFTPRRARSRWTELNKERARRLIRLGLMTEAGQRTLPDLSAKFEVADDILAAISVNGDARRNFETLPDLYVRVRLGYIEEMRKRPEEFSRRLENFVRQTALGKLYGNWNDNGRLL
ncbi:MAG: YdeI/OmpD-associated family protein [Pirellulaceae bacterium]|nr:YdeI/OmpD-associated family protein [Pirellulaceae bacterium]